MATALSKTERRRQERREAQDSIPPLDPPFPYRAVEFDPQFFGVDLDVDQQLLRART